MADRILIRGRRPISGSVVVSGAKNAALPIMAATLLTEGTTVLRRVPRLKDVQTLRHILQKLGMEVERRGDHRLRLRVIDEDRCSAPCDLVRRMRASVCVLGPLVARRGRAEVPTPGGCVIGDRPIDLHVKGLRALGARFEVEEKKIKVTADRLRGAAVDLRGPFGSTVLGTANVMMAATLAEGTTVIHHAACEPEVQDLAGYLNACGARIRGIGRRTLVIDGVERLHGTDYAIIPDRIEAGTFAAAAVATGGLVTLERARPAHLRSTLELLRRAGARVLARGDTVQIQGPERPQPLSFNTDPYPGVPTDMQPQLTSLLAMARGASTVCEGVYPERFTHVAELQRLGAHIARDENRAVVRGVEGLEGAAVTARDLRAGAGLVVAALAARGVTEIHGVEHLDRGYQELEKKLRALGADVRRTAA